MIRTILNNLQMLPRSLDELRVDIFFWFHDQDNVITANQGQGAGKKFLVFLYLSFIYNYYFKSSEMKNWKPGLEFVCVESLNINTDTDMTLESY